MRRRGDNAGMAGDDSRTQVQLDQDTLARRRRDLGEDHPDTLAAASALAVSLRAAGEYQAARELDEDTLARRRRVLGEDHPRHPGLRQQPRRRPACGRRAPRPRDLRQQRD
jgi:hypothetical protein